MHMEQIGKSIDERVTLAQRDIYAMANDILSMYGVENRGMATIIAYSDELDGWKWDEKDSWTFIGSSYFSGGIEGANDEKIVKELAKKINQNDLMGILRGTKELNNALVKLAEESATKNIPPELGEFLKWLAGLLAEAKKNSKDDDDEDEDEKPAKKKRKKKGSDDDILGGLNNLLR